jgi:hypothetical protein
VLAEASIKSVVVNKLALDDGPIDERSRPPKPVVTPLSHGAPVAQVPPSSPIGAIIVTDKSPVVVKLKVDQLKIVSALARAAYAFVVKEMKRIQALSTPKQRAAISYSS